MKRLDLLFEYVLCDAWHMPLQTLRLYDEETKNVYFIENDEERVFTISREDMTLIRDILKREKGLYEVKKWPYPPVMDGYTSSFVLRGNKRREIYVSNLWYYEENEGPLEFKLLINVFDEIAAVLKKYGIELYLNKM